MYASSHHQHYLTFTLSSSSNNLNIIHKTISSQHDLNIIVNMITSSQYYHRTLIFPSLVFQYQYSTMQHAICIQKSQVVLEVTMNTQFT